MSRSRAPMPKVQSADELAREAEGYGFSTNRTLRQWLRSGKQLLTEAAICEDDGDIQTAYVYLYRYANLVVEKLRGHPDYEDPLYKEDLRQARKELLKIMPKLERWKPQINKAHQRYLQALERREGERRRAEAEARDDQSRRLSADDFQMLTLTSRESPPSSPRYALDPNEHRQLALEFAQSELERRRASKQGSRRSESSSERSSSRRTSAAESYGATRRTYYDLEPHRAESQRAAVTTTYRYPSVPERQQRIEWDTPSPTRLYQSRDPPPPMRPTKEPIHGTKSSTRASYRDEPPAVPSKYDGAREPAPATPYDDTPSLPLPSRYTFKQTAFTESGAPLRSLFLPPDLRTTFLNIAHPNTARDVETCGILGGTIISGALFVSHLIIPDQTSTSDTCDTTEEGDNVLFDFCDSHQLLVCGWIHTHPSQSCFLSSRDLHTSSGYQVMLPEAIAIVCAPRHTPDWGIFRLTSPPGLKHVLDCRQTGIFHPHSEPNLYTDALRPGHVVEGPGLKFDVVDLRATKKQT